MIFKKKSFDQSILNKNKVQKRERHSPRGLVYPSIQPVPGAIAYYEFEKY